MRWRVTSPARILSPRAIALTATAARGARLTSAATVNDWPPLARGIVSEKFCWPIQGARPPLALSRARWLLIKRSCSAVRSTSTVHSSSASAADFKCETIASAAAVLQNLDKERYEAIPIRIEKDGRWIIADRLPTSSSAAEVIEQSRVDAARRLGRGGREAHLVAHPADEQIMTIERGTQPSITGLSLDVVFPVLHGPYGEDGTLQGLLELSGVPYVGSGVLASAVGQDKEYMKRVFTSFGLKVGPYVVIRPREWQLDESAARAIKELKFKPATRDGTAISVRALVRYNFRRTSK